MKKPALQIISGYSDKLSLKKRRFKGLIEQSRKHGIPVDTVTGDTAYFGKEHLKLSIEKEKGFALVSKINSAISRGHRSEEDKFDFNRDAGRFICSAGHMAIRRGKQGKKGQSKNQAYAYFFDEEKCKVCSRRKTLQGRSGNKNLQCTCKD
jgi:hypothetical protein